MREGENIMPVALGSTPTPFKWQRVYFSSQFIKAGTSRIQELPASHAQSENREGQTTMSFPFLLHPGLQTM